MTKDDGQGRLGGGGGGDTTGAMALGVAPPPRDLPGPPDKTDS